MNWISLSSESPGVIRDENGVPVEWTLLRIGSNPICQEGRDGSLVLTAEAMSQIIEYHAKKGELIPLDSEHYLYELANQKKLDESETLKLFPGGVAAKVDVLGKEFLENPGVVKKIDNGFRPQGCDSEIDRPKQRAEYEKDQHQKNHAAPAEKTPDGG